MNEIETIIQKQDISVLQIKLSRSRRGIVITAKADPSLEETFREWSGDRSVASNAHGRFWEGIDGPVPEAYSLGSVIFGQLTTSTGKPYRLDRLGTALYDDYGLNIGFIRLKGISEGPGVTFAVKGVISTEAFNGLLLDIRGAIAHFYVNYLKPIDAVINFQSQIQKL